MDTNNYDTINATPEERPEHVKKMLERAQAMKQEAEMYSQLLDAEMDAMDGGARTSENKERQAKAEAKIMEQMAKERMGKTSKVSSSNDESYFTPEMEKLISMALADGEVTPQEREVLRKKTQALGIDSDEMEMVLDSRLEKMEYFKQNGGKIFIENLQKEINNVCILEMGTYGKKVEDTHATNKRREEILLAANPTTPDEIKEYLYFISSKMNANEFIGMNEQKYWDKFEAVYTKAVHEFGSNPELMSSIKSLRSKLNDPIVKKAKKSIIIWAVVAVVALLINPIAGLVAIAIASVVILPKWKKIKSLK